MGRIRADQRILFLATQSLGAAGQRLTERDLWILNAGERRFNLCRPKAAQTPIRSTISISILVGQQVGCGRWILRLTGCDFGSQKSQERQNFNEWRVKNSSGTEAAWSLLLISALILQKETKLCQHLLSNYLHQRCRGNSPCPLRNKCPGF